MRVLLVAMILAVLEAAVVFAALICLIIGAAYIGSAAGLWIAGWR